MNAEDKLRIDVTKLTSLELFSFAKMVWRGTEGLKLWSILFGTVGLLFGFGFTVGKLSTSDDGKSLILQEKLDAERIIRQQKEADIRKLDDEISKLKADPSISILNEKIQKLEKNKEELNLSINSRPSYSTCRVYNGEMEKLRTQLEQVEAQIFWLAYPQPTAEMQKQGIISFTPEQVQAYAAQSLAVRPYAERLILQIKALEVTRKLCD